MRRAVLQRARCAPATLPTCDDLSVSRRLWNDSPRATAGRRAPYQLSSSTVDSKPASSSASARPAAVPLACTTRSTSRAAASASANATPSSAAIARLRGSTSTSSTSHAGGARCEPSDETAHRARADHRNAIADARPEVPEPVHGGFEVGGQHRARGRHAIGQHMQRGRGHDVPCLMRIQAEHVSADERGRPALDDPDIVVAVFHGRRKLSGLKRRAHPLSLARRHGAREDERLGTAADA